MILTQRNTYHVALSSVHGPREKGQVMQVARLTTACHLGVTMHPSLYGACFGRTAVDELSKMKAADRVFGVSRAGSLTVLTLELDSLFGNLIRKFYSVTSSKSHLWWAKLDS